MFAAANVPASQISHLDRSALGAKPSPHGVQLGDPGGATRPAEQFDAHIVEPASETLPASQRAQDVRSCSKYPASHGAHSAAPWPRATLPGAHGSQTAASAALKLPGEHMTQYERSLLGTRPAGHGPHFDEPACAT